MNEEAEVVEESGFDMEGAVDQIGTDLFSQSEPSEEEVEEEVEVEEKPKETPKEEPKDEKEEKPKEEKAEEVEEEKPKREAPNSWKKEYRELYSSADPALQEIIDLRENQMREGLEKDRSDANLGRTMRDVMTPYEAMFKDRGLEAPQAVQYLLNAHHRLTTGSPEQKIALMQQLSESYGISAPQEGQDPRLVGLTERLQHIEQNLNASQKRSIQENNDRIQAEVSAFAEDHPLFDDLADEMKKFIEAGYGLEDAYSMAERSSPTYIERELERRIKEQEEAANKQAKKEAEEAKKAKSVNVKAKHTKKAPTAPKGRFLDEDDMRETLREIQKRN
jgi:hypothetical protein